MTPNALSGYRDTEELGKARPLSREENELLSRVWGPALRGEMLRRYWIPALEAEELRDSKYYNESQDFGKKLQKYSLFSKK